MNIKNNHARHEKQNMVNWLADNFPAAFFLQAKRVKPLKIGIFDDIIDFYERLEAPPFSKKMLREALNYYSASPAYLSCQKLNIERIDLYGNPVDIVTDAQAQYAQQRYQQRYGEKQKNKRVKKESNNIVS